LWFFAKVTDLDTLKLRFKLLIGYVYMIKPIKIIEVKSEIGAGTRGASMGVDAIKIAALDFGSNFFKRFKSVEVINENNLLLERGINKSTLDSIADASEENVSLTNMVDEGNGKSKEANTGIAYAIGFGSGFLIYMTMFIFGAMVMRGVAEEKTNRIAEVIVSSCKPFELMMGKIVGIAGVGLTQLLLWITLMTILTSSLSAFIPAETYQQFHERVNKLKEQGFHLGDLSWTNWNIYCYGSPYNDAYMQNDIIK
jgi:hypothetical protein